MSDKCYGICRYCQQMRIIKPVPEDQSEANLNAIATSECECPEAERAREIRYAIERAHAYIDECLPEEEKAGTDILKAAAGPLVNGQIGSISIKMPDKVSYAMRMTRDGYVKITRKKVKEESEEV